MAQELGRLSRIEHLSPPDSVSNVEMISFYGPHFQDRYGIADRVFSTLQGKGYPLLASGCTGTSVHLVVHCGQAVAVAECLKNICIVP